MQTLYGNIFPAYKERGAEFNIWLTAVGFYLGVLPE
jgi:hypothetical protein